MEGAPSSYAARISFNIPISASSISFMALDRKGSYGSFRVSQTDEPRAEAVVEIEAKYRKQETIENVKVCRLYDGGWDLSDADGWFYGIVSIVTAA